MFFLKLPGNSRKVPKKILKPYKTIEFSLIWASKQIPDKLPGNNN